MDTESTESIFSIQPKRQFLVGEGISEFKESTRRQRIVLVVKYVSVLYDRHGK